MRWRGDLQLNAEAGQNDAILRSCVHLWTMPQPLMEESGLRLLHPTCETGEPIFPVVVVVVNHSVTAWTVARRAPLSIGILQARILEWVAMPSFTGSFQPMDQTQVSHIADRFFTDWATGEAQLPCYFGAYFRGVS